MVQLLFLTGRLKTAIITWDTCVLSHSVESNSFGPMDCGLPGSSVHGILQARILEGVAISFSRGSSQPRDQIHIPYIYLHWQAMRIFLESQNDGAARGFAVCRA